MTEGLRERQKGKQIQKKEIYRERYLLQKWRERERKENAKEEEIGIETETYLSALKQLILKQFQ